MLAATRFLLLCIAVLVLPAIAAAQPPPLAVERVWTQDAAGSNKNAFVPGDTIQFAMQLNNSYGGALLSAEATITTSFYNNTKTIDIPPGRSTQTWSVTAPSQQDNYTFTVRVYDSFYGSYAEGSANFAVTDKSVTQSPHPPGWYHNGAGAVPGISPIFYEDSTGLIITWQNSYIYRYPSDSALYWYAEVLYLNAGSDGLIIDCVGKSDPSLIKEHMRGTPNSGFVAAHETFCSRNPTFSVLLEPGETHFDWAIFHNVPWNGSEVAIEWGIYHRSSPWVNPWYDPYPPNAPVPAECPAELVELRTCETAEQRWQGSQPGYVCLGGRPGEQCKQPVKLIRQPIQWSQDPVTAIRESPLGPVEIYKLLQQHKGLECGMEMLPGIEGVKNFTKIVKVGAAIFGSDIFDGRIYMVPLVDLAGDLIPYESCVEILSERQFDPTQW